MGKIIFRCARPLFGYALKWDLYINDNPIGCLSAGQTLNYETDLEEVSFSYRFSSLPPSPPQPIRLSPQKPVWVTLQVTMSKPGVEISDKRGFFLPF